eukprot:GHVU01059857.1.p1 GENE.GHVU01059857.1~~GHVU01059857.1.p1  ORF type:complete len:318 (+),score=8.65 GHVU01059857.1:131-1084(+)
MEPPAYPVVLLRYSFVGNTIATILYGAYFALAVSIIYLLRRNGSIFYLGYTIIMFVTTTLYVCLALYQSYLLLILHVHNNWTQLATDIVFMMNTWMADGLIIFRCYHVWSDRRVIILPFILFLGAFGSSISFLWAINHSPLITTTRQSQLYSIPYWGFSVSLNILAACLISWKLLRVREKMKTTLGPRHGHQYVTIVAMIVESAALYTTVSCIALGTFASGNMLANIFVPMNGLIQVIAPNLIIWRVASGMGFDANKVTYAPSRVQFSSIGVSRTGATATGTGTGTATGTTATAIQYPLHSSKPQSSIGSLSESDCV